MYKLINKFDVNIVNYFRYVIVKMQNLLKFSNKLQNYYFLYKKWIYI